MDQKLRVRTQSMQGDADRKLRDLERALDDKEVRGDPDRSGGGQREGGGSTGAVCDRTGGNIVLWGSVSSCRGLAGRLRGSQLQAERSSRWRR